jgi:hypothetical protein
MLANISTQIYSVSSGLNLVIVKKYKPSGKLAPHAELPHPPLTLLVWVASFYKRVSSVVMVGFLCCCSQDVCSLRLHILHRANDHIAGVARLLLRTAVPVCPREGPTFGK